MATETEISLVYNRFAGTLNNPTVTYSITGVTGTTEYKYKVTAWNEQGETDGTEVVVSDGPSELNQGQYIRLEWQAVDRARRYRIYRYYNGVYAFLNDTDQLFYEDTSADTPNVNVNPPTKNNTNKLDWDAVEFLPGRRLQSAELNEIQAIQEYNVQKIGDTIFKDGDIISGCQVNVDKDNLKIILDSGEIYTKGRVRAIEGKEFTVDTFDNKTWYIGTQISYEYVDASDDPALLDPAQAYPGYGEEGAIRRVTKIEWTISDNKEDIAVPTWIIDNGSIRLYYQPPQYSELEKLFARKINDLEGQTLISGLRATCYKHPERRDKVILEITPGKAYVNGFEITKSSTTKLTVDVSLEKSSIIQESIDVSSGWLYVPDMLPVADIVSVSKRTFVSETRTVPTTTDDCGWYQDNTGSSIDVILGVWDSASKNTQYTESDNVDCANRNNDYVLVGSSICLNPSTFSSGTSYYIEYLRFDICTEGKRVKSTQTDSLTYSAGTNTYNLSKPDIIVNERNPIIVVDEDNNTYVYGTDFTVDKGFDETSIGTPSITFTGNHPADNKTFTVTYSYWNHTIEGDYVWYKSYLDETDPFRDYNLEDVYYKTAIDFRSATNKPASQNTEILVTYTYYLSKYSYLVLNDQGQIYLVDGDSAYNPVIPHRPGNVLTRYRIFFPALSQEPLLSVVHRFDVMKTEQRNILRNRVTNLEYNLLLTELEQELHNKQTTSPKKAILTDSFFSLKESAGDFNATNASIIPFAGDLILPQKFEQLSLSLDTQNNVKVTDTVITLDYTEEEAISNVLWTEDYAEDVTPFIYGKVPLIKIFPKVWMFYSEDTPLTPEPETTPYNDDEMPRTGGGGEEYPYLDTGGYDPNDFRYRQFQDGWQPHEGHFVVNPRGEGHGHTITGNQTFGGDDYIAETPYWQDTSNLDHGGDPAGWTTINFLSALIAMNRGESGTF